MNDSNLIEIHSNIDIILPNSKAFTFLVIQ